MHAEAWDPWNLLAFDQDWVLGRKQARAAGMSEDAWQWRLDDGLWRPVLPGVVTTHSGEATLNQELWASVVKVQPDAALTGDAGLVAAGLALDDLRFVDVARSGAAGRPWRLPSGRLVRPLQVARLRDRLAPGSGVPRLRPEVAVLHAAELAATDRAADWRLATTIQQGIARLPDVRQSLEQMPGLAREGVFRRALDDIELGATAMSELDFLALCRRNQLPEPDEMQVRVRAGGRTRYVDGRYRRQRVRFEVDGAHHMLAETWEADMLRSNEIAVASRVSDDVALRFTGRQVRYDDAAVVSVLRPLLL